MLCTANVYAADYIVTVKEGADVSGYEMQPVFEEIGLYIADEATAKELYDRGLAEKITENSPLYLPDDEYSKTADESIISGTNELVPLSSDYNDPYYSEEVYFAQNGIKDYIDTYKPSGKVRIAVIDTGVNREHRDFANADIETGYNYVTDSTDTSDLYGHGTMVTGIIASGANDGSGMAGIAPNATIVPLVAMTKIDGATAGTAAHLLLAMKAAVDTYDCKILTTSLGVTSGYSEINKAAQYAISKGVIVIGAAGNDGESTDTDAASRLYYPASSPGVISVGALDTNMVRASYSQKNTRIDVALCGGYFNMPSNSSATGYKKGRGTSFSAPVAAGITALFVLNHPDIMPKEYYYIIKGSAMDIADLGDGDYLGSGAPMMMQMEEMYNDTHPVYIAPVYKGSTNNIKIYCDGSVTKGVLVCVEFDNDVISNCEFVDIALANGFTYISSTAGSSTIRYFVIESLDSMKSLSLAQDY